MASIPTKVITNAYEMAQKRGHGGHGPWFVTKEGNRFKLYHYGTLILTVENGEVTYHRAYSASDKWGANSLLYLLGIPLKANKDGLVSAQEE